MCSPMIQIVILSSTLGHLTGADDSLFIAGNFNNWNNKEYLLKFDPAQKAYRVSINVNAELKECIIKFYNASKDEWFSLPSKILAVDERNEDFNNIVILKDLPLQNDYVTVIANGQDGLGKTGNGNPEEAISRKKDQNLPSKASKETIEPDLAAEKIGFFEDVSLNEKTKTLKKTKSNFIVLQDEEGCRDDEDAAEISASNLASSTPTEMIKHESYSNILLSTNNNDMVSLASSSNRTQLSNSVKMKFDGDNPPSSSTSQTQDNTGSSKHHQPGLKNLFKKVLGYR